MYFCASLGSLSAQTEIFATGFEGTNITANDANTSTSDWNRNDILPTSTDAWLTTFPDYNVGVGELFFQYDLIPSENNFDDMSATIVADPEDPNNTVLRFAIEDHNHNPDPTKRPVGRVQTSMHFEDDQMNPMNNHIERCNEPGLERFHYSTDLYIPMDFSWMLADEVTNPAVFVQDYDFMALAEFWNNSNWAEDVNGNWEGNGLRISVNLHKNDGENVFRLTAKADPRIVDPNDPNDFVWGDPLWWHISSATIGLEADNPDFLLEDWLHLDYYFIEGNGDTGKFVFRINGINVFDVNDWTHNPDEPNAQPCQGSEPPVGPDGIKHLHPLKLYTNDVTIEGFQGAPLLADGTQPVCHVFWDNFIFNGDFNHFEHNIICPETTCAIVGEVANNTFLNDFDVEQDPTLMDGTGGEMFSLAANQNGIDDLDLGERLVGLQFANIEVPQNATIIEAYVQFTAKFGSTGTTTIDIHGEPIVSAANAVDFSNVDQHLEIRRDFNVNNVMESQSWVLPIWDGSSNNASGPNQRTSDLSVLIRNMMEDNGNQISIGDRLTFIFDPGQPDVNGDFSGNHTAISLDKAITDDDFGVAPRLCIRYATALTGQANMWSANDPFPVPGVSMVISADTDPCDMDGDMETNDALVTSSVTNVLGEYRNEICGIALEYNVVPFKNNDLLCGVSGFDLGIISRHILGIEPYNLNNYERLAADVNGSNTVSTNDLVGIRYLILYQEINPLPAFTFIPWKFHNAAAPLGSPVVPFGPPPVPPVHQPSIQRTFPGLSNTANFEVIKGGDVNCSCAQEGLEQVTAAPDINIKIEDIEATKDEIVEVKFRVENFSGVEAYQIGIDFDKDLLEYMSTSSGDLGRGADPEAFGLSEIELGRIRNLWLYNDASELEHTTLDTSLVDDSSLFVMSFKALEDIERAKSKLSDLIRLDDKVLANRAYTKAGIHKVNLTFVPEGTFDHLNTNSPLLTKVTCFPNPMKEQITFDLDLLKGAEVNVQVFTPTGQMIAGQQLRLTKGHQQIPFEDANAWPKGMYYYAIKLGNELVSGKFVKQ